MGTQCLCCGGKEYKLFCDGIIQCKDCNYATVNGSYSDEELGGLYQQNYFRGGEYRNYIESEALYRRNFRNRVVEMRRFLPDGSRIWEIGCAYGYFLREANKYYDTEGIDITEEGVQYAKDAGLKARCDDFLKFPVRKAYDAVCLWDTLEHLRNPMEFISKAHSILRPNGMLFITTGDVGALVPRIQKGRWRLIHPPTHLHYFSRPGIRTLLSGIGFEIIKIKSVSFWHNIENICHGLEQFGGYTGVRNMSKVMHRILPKWIREIYFPVNLGDIMLVVARKMS